jgi:hypothetical protein
VKRASAKAAPFARQTFAAGYMSHPGPRREFDTVQRAGRSVKDVLPTGVSSVTGVDAQVKSSRFVNQHHLLLRWPLGGDESAFLAEQVGWFSSATRR